MGKLQGLKNIKKEVAILLVVMKVLGVMILLI